MFPVKIINGEQPFIEEVILVKNKTIKSRRIKRLDDDRLLSLAKKGNRKPGTRNVNIVQYERNEAVAEFAKRIAKGICQLCGKKHRSLIKMESHISKHTILIGYHKEERIQLKILLLYVLIAMLRCM